MEKAFLLSVKEAFQGKEKTFLWSQVELKYLLYTHLKHPLENEIKFESSDLFILMALLRIQFDRNHDLTNFLVSEGGQKTLSSIDRPSIIS